MKPYVVYWNNIPAPYMVERFNAVADSGVLDFEAWFNDRLEPDRSWNVNEKEWRFRYRYLPTTTIAGSKLHWPIPVLGRMPDVLVSLYAEPSFLTGWAVAKMRGAKTAFWCQVTFDQWVSRKWWKEKLKNLIFPQVDVTLGSGEESRQFAIRYGVAEAKALCLRHSIDVHHYSNGHQLYYPVRDKIRCELGVVGSVFIYVGRLWWGKGINYLLEAFDTVQKQSSDEVSLLLVGDGPEDEALKQLCAERGIRNVIFAGFHQKHEMPRFYSAADVFVFPTLGDPYGLVVDEAMASSMPIISTSAAGEIADRVEQGVNGYVVPPSNPQAMAEKMLYLANNPQQRVRMGQISAGKISGHTPEQWAIDFESIIGDILDH
jgi:glycosyltransferase involved in cell wall biosynthesis